ncbi:hypothetical protein DL770_003652 [Monosporascus sp. CRB-9-2]|nr:hypothetical protein DL770_003652 [Monosporascus sp. CRB-9-2]
MFPGGPNPVQVQFVQPHHQANPPSPLVLVHDGGGSIFSYFILGDLNRDVWAIYNPKYFDGEAWEGGMDEMARHYIDLIVSAGIRGDIMLGGWSLGGLLSLVMARMLADDPSASLSITGFLIIDSPYHIAKSNLTIATSDPKLEGIPDLVLRSFDNCDNMLKEWDLPSWDGPAGGGKGAKLRIAGQNFTLQPGSVLYKPLGGDWKPINTRRYQYAEPGEHPVSAPPGVMIRCTRRTEKMEGSGPEPALDDLYRDEVLLGWEGNYPDFLKAVIDVDDDHFSIFDANNRDKARDLTLQVNACLEILDSLSGPTQIKPSLGP